MQAQDKGMSAIVWMRSRSSPVTGRRREFAQFAWQEEIPDPQDAQTFERSRLDLALRDQGRHCALLRFYRDLIATRKRSAALHTCDKEHLDVRVVSGTGLLLIRRWQPEGEEVLIVAFFASDAVSVRVPIPAGCWLKTVDASTNIYGGSTGMPGLPSILEEMFHSRYPLLRSPLRSTGGTQKLKS